MALRIYSSGELLTGVDKEFCSVLSEAMRDDYAPKATAVFALALNSHLVTNVGRGGVAPVNWPANNKVYRGGGLPREHHHFFQVGRKYRIPMNLSTSSDRRTAEGFMSDRGAPDFTLWTFEFDPSSRCDHVNFVHKNAGDLADEHGNPIAPDVAAEQEYLFAVYATFEVVRVNFRAAPTAAAPHEVVLRVAVDNSAEATDLPNAPWA